MSIKERMTPGKCRKAARELGGGYVAMVEALPLEERDQVYQMAADLVNQVRQLGVLGALELLFKLGIYISGNSEKRKVWDDFKFV